MVSPIKPIELMIGKIIPYIVIMFLDLLLILLGGYLVFGVPFRGSLSLFFVFSLLFIGASLSMGIFISTIAKTCQVAWLVGFISTILPSILLSGFIFPISSMPKPVQLITYLLPIRYFLVIIRGIILKGVGIGVLYKEALVLCGFLIFMIIVSSKRFRKRAK